MAPKTCAYCGVRVTARSRRITAEEETLREAYPFLFTGRENSSHKCDNCRTNDKILIAFVDVSVLHKVEWESVANAACDNFRICTVWSAVEKSYPCAFRLSLRGSIRSIASGRTKYRRFRQRALKTGDSRAASPHPFAFMHCSVCENFGVLADDQASSACDCTGRNRFGNPVSHPCVKMERSTVDGATLCCVHKKFYKSFLGKAAQEALAVVCEATRSTGSATERTHRESEEPASSATTRESSPERDSIFTSLQRAHYERAGMKVESGSMTSIETDAYEKGSSNFGQSRKVYDFSKNRKEAQKKVRRCHATLERTAVDLAAAGKALVRINSITAPGLFKKQRILVQDSSFLFNQASSTVDLVTSEDGERLFRAVQIVGDMHLVSAFWRLWAAGWRRLCPRTPWVPVCCASSACDGAAAGPREVSTAQRIDCFRRACLFQRGVGSRAFPHRRNRRLLGYCRASRSSWMLEKTWVNRLGSAKRLNSLAKSIDKQPQPLFSDPLYPSETLRSPSDTSGLREPRFQAASVLSRDRWTSFPSVGGCVATV
eukprot:scaffold519_cov188-Pinguiococcus_pyrenoidosus.AAC.1